jgi:hypothetical protein
MVSEKIKKRKRFNDGLYVGILLMSMLSAFYIGKISEQQKNTSVHSFYDLSERVFSRATVYTPVHQSNSREAGKFVASINGSRYYPATCPSAGRISDSNLRSFESEDQALQEGYTRAKTCDLYW